MADNNSQSGGWLRSRTGLVFLGFAAIAGFLLWEEHKAHLLGAVPETGGVRKEAGDHVMYRGDEY